MSPRNESSFRDRPLSTGISSERSTAECDFPPISDWAVEPTLPRHLHPSSTSTSFLGQTNPYVDSNILPPVSSLTPDIRLPMGMTPSPTFKLKPYSSDLPLPISLMSSGMLPPLKVPSRTASAMSDIPMLSNGNGNNSSGVVSHVVDMNDFISTNAAGTVPHFGITSPSYHTYSQASVQAQPHGYIQHSDQYSASCAGQAQQKAVLAPSADATGLDQDRPTGDHSQLNGWNSFHALHHSFEPEGGSSQHHDGPFHYNAVRPNPTPPPPVQQQMHTYGPFRASQSSSISSDGLWTPATSRFPTSAGSLAEFGLSEVDQGNNYHLETDHEQNSIGNPADSRITIPFGIPGGGHVLPAIPSMTMSFNLPTVPTPPTTIQPSALQWNSFHNPIGPNSGYRSVSDGVTPMVGDYHHHQSDARRATIPGSVCDSEQGSSAHLPWLAQARRASSPAFGFGFNHTAPIHHSQNHATSTFTATSIRPDLTLPGAHCHSNSNSNSNTHSHYLPPPPVTAFSSWDKPLSPGPSTIFSDNETRGTSQGPEDDLDLDLTMEVEQLQDGDLKYGPGTAYRHASAQGGGGGGGSGKKGKKGPSKGKAKSKSKVKPKDKGIMLNPSSAVNVGPWIVKHANPAGRTPAELHELGYGTIVFTDDAEVKQTAEVRRRCHNCDNRDPPSWRKSVIACGKILCNKCGIYERTHHRPRPPNTDDLKLVKVRQGESQATTAPEESLSSPVAAYEGDVSGSAAKGKIVTPIGKRRTKGKKEAVEVEEVHDSVSMEEDVVGGVRDSVGSQAFSIPYQTSQSAAPVPYFPTPPSFSHQSRSASMGSLAGLDGHIPLASGFSPERRSGVGIPTTSPLRRTYRRATPRSPLHRHPPFSFSQSQSQSRSSHLEAYTQSPSPITAVPVHSRHPDTKPVEKDIQAEAVDSTIEHVPSASFDPITLPISTHHPPSPLSPHQPMDGIASLAYPSRANCSIPSGPKTGLGLGMFVLPVRGGDGGIQGIAEEGRRWSEGSM